MKAEVEKVFDNQIIAKFFSNKPIMDFLLKHERKSLCLENLCLQIRMAELGVKDFNVYKYYTLINGVADMFAGAALKAKEDELVSINERKLREQKQAAYDELKTEFEKHNGQT